MTPEIRTRLERAEAVLGPWDADADARYIRTDIRAETNEDLDRKISLRQIEEYLAEKHANRGKIQIDTDITSDRPCQIVDLVTRRTVMPSTDFEYPSYAQTFGFDLHTVQRCPNCKKTVLVPNLDDGRTQPVYFHCENCMDAGSTITHACCTHDRTDGTVQCPACGLSAGAFISAASDFLSVHHGLTAEDPGYFTGDVLP
jgi:hypothetical protein